MRYRRGNVFGKPDFCRLLPPQAAAWCNDSGTYHIEEIEPEDGVRRFQIVQNTIPELSAEDHIGILQLQLSATDYVAIKIAEGVADREKYADILAQRQQWRNEINFLEAILKEKK